MPRPTATSGQNSNPSNTGAGYWMRELTASLASERIIVIGFFAGLFLTGLVEWSMGRSLLGPDGKFGVWQGNIWSSECSQRVADPYSFSHVVHGILFYLGLWLIGRHWPIRNRFMIAAALEAGWEILENSPVMIARYRQTTIALGYDGDSVLNSVSDILMMALGFLFAARFLPWQSLVLLALMELGCAYWIRDNLTLNVIMLVHPIEAIKQWQAAGRAF